MAPTELVGMLSLDQVGPNRYLGHNLTGSQAVIFGGQLLAQVIAAATGVTPDMRLKSMHTIFARGGRPEKDVEFEVERLHGGRSFGSLQVSIRQGERLCARSLVLVHQPDGTFISHQDDPPVVPPPEQCLERPMAGRGWEVRIPAGVDTSDPEAIGPPELALWSKFADVPPDLWMSQALLAYASDGFLIGTAMRPHPGVGQALAHVSISTSVITQTLTFHEEFDAGDWLLFFHRSPYAGFGRSYGRADVFSIEGRLVASFVQENMIRALTDDRPSTT
jgi:acyl-CoA thioesterase II